MEHDVLSEWGVFYQTLNRLGPRLLVGVEPDLIEYISLEAGDTDSFWSEGLEYYFELWKEGEKDDAVKNALEEWVSNVKGHLHNIFGPNSVIPFEDFGVNEASRYNTIRSIDKIKLKLNKKQRSLFIDSVLINYANQNTFPNLVIQSIITPYGNVPDGKLVRALATPWHIIIKHLKQNWNLAYQIPYEKWEELIAAAFDRSGYDEVILTPRSGDHGRDVIAIKKGIGTVRIIDSVKAYKPGHLVKHDDVRALAGVLLGDPQASKGILTTTSDFAPGIANDPFLKPLIPYRLELMNGNALQRWLEELALSQKGKCQCSTKRSTGEPGVLSAVIPISLKTAPSERNCPKGEKE